jgi:DnaJ homolog subfamily B member 5
LFIKLQNIQFLLTSLDRSNGSTNHNNNSNFHYEFHGDPRQTFESFFGTSNPFSSFFDHDNIFDHHNNLFSSMGGIDDDFFSSPFGLGRSPGLGTAFR